MKKIKGSVPFWGQSIPQININPILKDYSIFLRRTLRYKSHDIPSLEPFLLPRKEKSLAPCIIIAPGGGYSHLAPHEGKPVAEWLNSIGISACVLYYRNAPNRHPIPILDAQRAIRVVRSNATKWHIDPGRIGFLGFSAGGHLAATAATIGELNFFPPNYSPDTIDTVSAKLNLSILCYPVISMKEFTNRGSKKNLLGTSPGPELETLLSPHLQVNSSTPPTFIWTTEEDKAVPYQNTEMYADALDSHGIPNKKVLFEYGRHGLGLAEKQSGVSQWPLLCEEWMKKIEYLDPRGSIIV